MVGSYTLNDGNTIPKIGLGTWQSSEKDAYSAVLCAVECGYRHIDTAYVYENENGVGKAIKQCGADRRELYITTKLPSEIKTFKGAKEYLHRSLDALGLDYLDLYLIHAPWPWSDVGSDCTAGNIEAWNAMAEMRDEGLIKSIGVSNFGTGDIENLVKATGITPAVNQIRFYIGNTQEPLSAYCREKGILIEAYSPFATGKILDNGKISAIAEKLGVTVTKLCLAYCLQRGTLPLPKSVTPERIRANLDAELTIPADDMEILNGISGLFPRPYRS